MKVPIFLITVLILNNAIAQTNPIIQIESYEQTNSAIVVKGKAHIVPIGTKISVEVTSIDGKRLDPIRYTMKSIDNVSVEKDRTFIATIKRLGSLDGYDFPQGKYELEFDAYFNMNWQTKDVLVDAGIKFDAHGYAIEDSALTFPKSSDLVLDLSFGNTKRRILKATRTIHITEKTGVGLTYKTKSMRLEIHDTKSMNNPVRTIPVKNDLLFREVIKKVGRLHYGQAVVLVCLGSKKDGAGHLADDLYFSDGRQNPDLKIIFATSLSDLCRQQEDALKKRQQNFKSLG